MSAIQQVLAAGGWVADTTPNAFSFTDQGGVELNTLTTSNAITISGINTATNVSMSGGISMAYSIAGGSFISSGGTITNGQTLQVRQQSSGTYSGAVQSTVTVGGTSTVWTVYSRAADTTPNAFSFPSNVTGATINQTYFSDVIYISGMDPFVQVFVSVYSPNGGNPLLDTGASGTGSWVSNRTVNTDGSGGVYVRLQMSAPSTAGTTHTATLSCSAVSADWSIST